MLKNIANGIKEACNGDLTHRNRPRIYSPGGVQYDKGKAGEATQKARRRSRSEKSSKSVTHLLSRAPEVHMSDIIRLKSSVGGISLDLSLGII